MNRSICRGNLSSVIFNNRFFSPLKIRDRNTITKYLSFAQRNIVIIIRKKAQFFRTLNNNIVSPLLRLYANDRAVDDNGGRGQGLQN